jgi:hypothetical protein
VEKVAGEAGCSRAGDGTADLSAAQYSITGASIIK